MLKQVFIFIIISCSHGAVGPLPLIIALCSPRVNHGLLNAYYVLMELILVVENQGVARALSLKKTWGKK